MGQGVEQRPVLVHAGAQGDVCCTAHDLLDLGLKNACGFLSPVQIYQGLLETARLRIEHEILFVSARLQDVGQHVMEFVHDGQSFAEGRDVPPVHAHGQGHEDDIGDKKQKHLYFKGLH